ncbi:DUF4365 domain-containing protein [Streptomyces sp. NPDC012637]|uniref:DUF4365 domain-containing protein n=1 Tax=Streptomyces sp. NPDC012637 TaxID=3364842 RepID=UPI0036ED0A86
MRKVDEVVNDAGCLWRETLTHDVGIDGQIEYVDPEGRATGRLVAVQIKSGASYFSSRSDGYVHFRPEPKHRNYWASFPLPVIVVLHHPEEDLTIWADARHHLRYEETSGIAVPENRRLTPAAVLDVLRLDGELPALGFDPVDLMHRMAAQSNGTKVTSQSFFDLFFHGLTDLAHCLYFAMDLALEIRSAKDLLLDHEDRFLSWGPDDYAFLDRYIAFLVAHDLVRLDFDNWRRSTEDGLVGVFLAPLTRKGRDLVRTAAELDKAFFPPEQGPRRSLVEERPVHMPFTDAGERLLHIERFKETLRHQPR